MPLDLLRACRSGACAVSSGIVGATKSKIAKNLARIRENIAAACDCAGRDRDEVGLVVVTKSVALSEIKSLLGLGVTELGESRVQQLTQRAAELDEHLRRRNGSPARPRWHMVGHLQRNKVRAAIDVADVIQSVDSLRLAEEIEARAEHAGRCVEVMLQVNCSEEPQKFGCAVGAALHLGELICTLKHLRLIGLMTIGPLTDDPQGARPAFVRLRELFEEMRHEKIGGEEFRHLSMGMSNDYTVAVEEGATILRIGTAVFA